jgi:hypothetical protein
MPAATLIMLASATPQLKKRPGALLLEFVEQLIADVPGQQNDAGSRLRPAG